MRSVRRSAWLAAAVLLLLAMTTAGLATGLFQSIFARMIDDGFAGEPTTDYAKLDEMSQKDLSVQTVVFSDGASAEVKLEQAYYNGEQLVLGWSSRGAEEARFLERDDPRLEDVEPTEYEVDGQASVMPVDLYARVGREKADEFYRRLEADGWAGIFWMDCYLGDGTFLKGVPSTEVWFDGTPIEEEDTRLYPETSRDWMEDGRMQSYVEYEAPLPEAARNQDVLTVMRRVCMTPMWYCEDSTGRYYGQGGRESAEVFFKIPRGRDYEERSYHADAAFPNHTASIDLKVTPIKAEFAIRNRTSDEWIAIWEEYEGYYVPPLNLREDIVFWYEVWIEEDGALSEASPDCDGIDGAEGLEGCFVLPESAAAVVFRPVYANTGAHPQEDVRMELNQN